MGRDLSLSYSGVQKKKKKKKEKRHHYVIREIYGRSKWENILRNKVAFSMKYLSYTMIICFILLSRKGDYIPQNKNAHNLLKNISFDQIGCQGVRPTIKNWQPTRLTLCFSHREPDQNFYYTFDAFVLDFSLSATSKIINFYDMIISKRPMLDYVCT